MTARRTRPPRLAGRVLAAVLPRTGEGRSTLGDLLEEYHQRPSGFGRRIWFWLVTLDLARRYLPARLAAGAGATLRDLVYAVRVARRRPVLTLATMVTLALAIGTSTAAFSVANGSWLRLYLSEDPSILLTWRMRENGGSKLWPTAELLALRGRTSARTIEGAAALTRPIGNSREAQQDGRVLAVTGTYLETFDAGRVRGRLLEAADDVAGAAPVAVIDHQFWRQRFAGDSGVVGRTIWMGDSPFTVVGIAARDFVDPTLSEPDVWVPLASLPHSAQSGAGAPGLPALHMLTRLHSSATERAADEELTALLPGVAGLAPGAPVATGVESAPVLQAESMSQLRLLVFGGLGVVALVLLLACANVSNLQLAGAAARSREIAVRLSCGASRWRVLRQLATECALVGAVSGVAGFLVARAAAPLMAIGLGWPDADVDLDVRTYAFATAVTLAAALGSGVAPALLGSRHGAAVALKSAGPVTHATAWPGNRAKAVFLCAQAAASIVIVALSALLVRTVMHIAWLGPGYDVDKLLTVSIAFPHDDVGRARAAAFWGAALDRVRAMPAVEAASLAYAPPFGISLGDPEQQLDNPTDEAYFAATGLRTIAGRTYTGREVASRAPVVVLSEDVARRFWPDENPVGSMAARLGANHAGHEVIGVVASAMAVRVHARGAAMVYVPGVWPDWAKLTVRTSDPRALVAPLRETLRAISPDVQPNVVVVADRFGRELVGPRRRAGLAMAIAFMTLALSVVGLAGVTMFAVQARTREIGVRLALGARPREITGLLLRDGLRAVVIGLAIGLAGAWAAGRYVSGLLYGMSAQDPLAIGGAVAVLLGSATLAVLVPTRRAADLDPATVLKEG